jgi:glycosyltransferase involved in cell wall biosynthesis
MNVALLYMDALHDGGYPRDIRWLAGALARQGLSVSLAANPGTHEDGLDSVTLADPEDFASLARGADVVHIWMLFVPGQFSVWRTIGSDVRLVVSPAAQLLPAHLRRRWWKKIPYLLGMQPTLLRHRPVAHLFSEAERPATLRWLHTSRYFEASLGVFPASVEPVPVIDSHDYLLFFGRNDVYQKGIDILLRAYADASSAGLDIPLVIAGRPHGDSASVLPALIADLGIDRRVQVLGEVPEESKNQLIQRARCFVFLSRWDGPPRPIRDAIALGTPVIVSRETTLGGLVDKAGAGRQVNLDVHNVAAALLETRVDATIKLWSNGVHALRGDLTWDRVAERYISGYRLAAESA